MLDNCKMHLLGLQKTREEKKLKGDKWAGRRHQSQSRDVRSHAVSKATRKSSELDCREELILSLVR